MTSTLPRRSTPLRSLAVAASYPLLLAPFWRRTWMHRLGRLAMVGVYIYLGALAALLILEDHFLYHATPAAEIWLPPPAGARVEDVALHSSDGNVIHAWWSALTAGRRSAGPFCSATATPTT